MAVSTLSAPDPFPLDDTIAPGHNATAGLTARSLTIDPTKKTLILITSGQSLMCNTSPTAYSPTNGTVIDNFNIYDGAAYPVSGALLGCSNVIPVGLLGPGNISGRIADKIIATMDRVIIVPIGIGGTSVADWTTGHLANRMAVTMRRLAARGITPSTTGVTFVQVWGQGESDGAFGTTQSAYQAGFMTHMANCTAAGFVGKTFVNLETLIHNITYPVIRAAQAAVVNGTTILQGGDLDTLTGGTNRQADDTHLTDAGAASAATLIYAAMHASGTPL